MQPQPAVQAGNTTKPLVSVIIPSRNRAKLLREALTSVFAQEGAGEQFEMEVVVIDDASSDDTPEVVRHFPAVHYLRFDTNQGASGARNAGILAIKGKYIAFLDDDDIWFPHRLKAHVPLIEAHPEVGVLYGQVKITGETTHLEAWPEWAPSGRVFEDFLTRTDDFMHPDAMLVRREVFDRAGLFDVSFGGMEHYEMILRLAFYAGFMFVEGPVGNGRYSNNGLWCTTVVNGQNERQLPLIIEKSLALLPPTPESETVRRKARLAVCTTIAGQRWWAGGGVEAVREYLLTALKANPWMAAMPPMWEHVRKVARVLACSSPEPISAVEQFWDQIIFSVDASQIPSQYTLENLLSEGAIGLREDGSLPRKAGLVATQVMLRYPRAVSVKLVGIALNSLVVLAGCVVKAIVRKA